MINVSILTSKRSNVPFLDGDVPHSYICNMQCINFLAFFALQEFVQI